MIRAIFVNSIQLVIPNHNLLDIILDYLPVPRITITKLTNEPTNRFFITLQFNEKRPSDVYIASNILKSMCDCSVNQSSMCDTHFIMYHHNDYKTVILLDSGAQEETCHSVKINARGSLVFLNEPKDLTMMIYKLCATCNVAITTVPDNIFAQQWINYVGCHGYMLYPQWICGGSSAHTVREMSFNTYIRTYWQKRKDDGCDLTGSCKCNELIHPHHLCREYNNVHCRDLRACLCQCENCNDIDGDNHNCLTPEEQLCFTNY